MFFCWACVSICDRTASAFVFGQQISNLQREMSISYCCSIKTLKKAELICYQSNVDFKSIRVWWHPTAYFRPPSTETHSSLTTIIANYIIFLQKTPTTTKHFYSIPTFQRYSFFYEISYAELIFMAAKFL